MTKIKVREYPKLIEEFAKENFNLKTLVGVLLALLFINGGVLIYAIKKGPMVIPLEANGVIGKINPYVTVEQVQEAIKSYLKTRYTWTYPTIETQIKNAEPFVAPNLLSSFRKSMMSTLKYVKNKKVDQRVYPRSIDVDFKKNSASITADRFTEFDGLKAATVMHLLLSFELGDRTVPNPWGVYITKETEKASQ